MISPAALRAVVDRAISQLRTGLSHLSAGRPVEAEVWLRAAHATLTSIAAALDGERAEPMRKLAIVGPAEPEWFGRKAGEGPDAA